MSAFKGFKRYTRWPREMESRGLTTTHKERQAAGKLLSRQRAARREFRRTEFEARQLIVRERLAKQRKKEKA